LVEFNKNYEFMLINSWKNIDIKIYNNDKLIFYFVD